MTLAFSPSPTRSLPNVFAEQTMEVAFNPKSIVSGILSYGKEVAVDGTIHVFDFKEATDALNRTKESSSFILKFLGKADYLHLEAETSRGVSLTNAGAIVETDMLLPIIKLARDTKLKLDPHVVGFVPAYEMENGTRQLIGVYPLLSGNLAEISFKDKESTVYSSLISINDFQRMLSNEEHCIQTFKGIGMEKVG